MRAPHLAVVLLGSCSAPERGEPELDAAARGSSAAAETLTSAAVTGAAASQAPGATPPATSAATPGASAEAAGDGAPVPSASTPLAQGVCVARSKLETAGGEVSCYPFRCRDGRCLTACSTRKDCAGSDGPGDLAENGWPLDCHGTKCVPLPPRHVRR